MSKLSQKDKQGLILVGLVVVAFVGMFGLYFAVAENDVVDKRLCPSVVTRKTAILIDQSDEAPTQTLAEIRSRIAKTINQDVAEGELVSVFYLSDHSQLDLRPVFSGCKPKADGNELYENRRLIKKQFEDSFQNPLDEALAENPISAEKSPIAEVMADFLTSDFLDGEENRLVVFSDLMQNSAALDLYGCANGQQAIADYRRSRSGAVERPELQNVQIELNIVPRQSLSAQNVKCRQEFWAWFFGNNEGEKAGLTSSYLPGGATVQ